MPRSLHASFPVSSHFISWSSIPNSHSLVLCKTHSSGTSYSIVSQRVPHTQTASIVFSLSTTLVHVLYRPNDGHSIQKGTTSFNNLLQNVEQSSSFHIGCGGQSTSMVSSSTTRVRHLSSPIHTENSPISSCSFSEIKAPKAPNFFPFTVTTEYFSIGILSGVNEYIIGFQSEHSSGGYGVFPSALASSGIALVQREKVGPLAKTCSS
mmetsp:Transcript_11924/g.22084  ORF Transcript_11924/g.22084 Transcript_11924/m.22084 type:complete len:208 (+) Transcript_11924:1309-1932(+)